MTISAAPARPGLVYLDYTSKPPPLTCSFSTIGL